MKKTLRLQNLRPCLVKYLNNTFLVFKQHYIHFYTHFHIHVFQNTTNNITQTFLPNKPLIVKNIDTSQHQLTYHCTFFFFFCWESHTIALGSGWKESSEIALERETTHKHKQRRNYTLKIIKLRMKMKKTDFILIYFRLLTLRLFNSV